MQAASDGPGVYKGDRIYFGFDGPKDWDDLDVQMPSGDPTSVWQGLGMNPEALGQLKDLFTAVAYLLVPGGEGVILGRGAEEGAEVGIQANKIAGDAFRDKIAGLLQNEGREVSTEVYKWTPFGKRFIDIEVSQGGSVLGGIETKLGSSRYLPLQRLKDIWLEVNTGYKVQVVTGP